MESAKYVQERVGDYITLYTGRHFYPLQPRKEDITVVDIAHSLSRLARYGGHLEDFYSVGEHSVYCYEIAKQLNLTPLQQMYTLMHDASESIVNDVVTPLKQHIPLYKDIEHNVMNVIWDMIGVPHPTEEDYEQVKLIDSTLLVNEMNQLGKRQDTPNVSHHDTIKVDFSKKRTMKETKEAFLEAYNQLEDVLGLGANRTAI